MEYKKVYTDEEIDELVSWFKGHMDQLPQSLNMGKGIVVPDLKHTVQLYINIVQRNKSNPVFAAQIYHLFNMRDAVLQLQNGNAEEAKP